MSAPASEFEARLRAIGAERYHHRHPFNLRMHAGQLSRDELRTWVANRYYYQTRIPVKDGLILAKSGDPAFRRGWIGRIQDHDGTAEREGGLALWLALARAVGLDAERVASLCDVLPGVRRACDAYVAFVESHDLLESVAASLTELFAGDIMGERIAAFEKHYPWVDADGLRYFRSRTVQAPSDARYGLAYVLEHAHTAADRDRCVAALERKCEILWNLLDAIEAAHAALAFARAAQPRLEDPEPLVVLPERAVKLAGSAREILRLCDGKRTAIAIAAELRDRHPQVEKIADDVHDFLDEMVKLGVLDCERP
ncbi:MAG TPA: pyrroloquinoline-quinone synthase PqqC [Myxococcota bacterium]|nr:pyrroloquinoline-quinone synthase PqqC [Myxococcota bacterium]